MWLIEVQDKSDFQTFLKRHCSFVVAHLSLTGKLFVLFFFQCDGKSYCVLNIYVSTIV